MKQALLATVALFSAAPTFVEGTTSSNQVVIFSLEKDGNEIPLLTTLEDLPRYFEAARSEKDRLDFPPEFEWPRSYSYELTFGQMTRQNKQEKIFEGAQKAIYDAENNRVRFENEDRIFWEGDTEVRVYDFDQMRLLVSNPIKRLCLKQKITDISPVSMVPREHDQIDIADAIQSLWVHPAVRTNDETGSPSENLAKSKYLGEHLVTLRSTSKTLLDKEQFHIFQNNYSFLNLEEKFAQRGGVDGASTLYLYCNLGTTFQVLEPQIMNTNDFQLKFYQKECHQYLDEYMLVDGNLVKIVAAPSVLQ